MWRSMRDCHTPNICLTYLQLLLCKAALLDYCFDLDISAARFLCFCTGNSTGNKYNKCVSLLCNLPSCWSGYATPEPLWIGNPPSAFLHMYMCIYTYVYVHSQLLLISLPYFPPKCLGKVTRISTEPKAQSDSGSKGHE